MSDSALGLKEDGSFRFHIPFDLKKSRDGRIEIEGIASIQSPDISGETVIQKGMDLSYFLKRGFFNDNHAKDSGGKVGVPTYAEHTAKGLHVKGYLLDTQRAQDIVELAAALQKSGGDRQLGFSVEGRVNERAGKIINKSWIKDIAITAEPVHPDTYMNICKSLSARIEKDGFADEPNTTTQEALVKLEDSLTKSVTDALKELKKTLPINGEETEKSLEAGHQSPPASGGSALRKESLERDLKNQDIPQGEEEDDEEIDSGIVPEDVKKRLNKSQAIEIVKERGYSDAAAKKMVDLLFDKTVIDFLN